MVFFLLHMLQLANFHRIPCMYFNTEVSPKPTSFSFWSHKIDVWALFHIIYLHDLLLTNGFPLIRIALSAYILIILASICWNTSKAKDVCLWQRPRGFPYSKFGKLFIVYTWQNSLIIRSHLWAPKWPLSALTYGLSRGNLSSSTNMTYWAQ